jgi:hypothetical protein
VFRESFQSEKVLLNSLAVNALHYIRLLLLNFALRPAKSLIFTGPCIVIYSYNKSQQDALFLNFILIKFVVCSILASLAVNITSMINTNCCEYSIKTPDDGRQV